MMRLTLTGNTYGIREALKGLGFRWTPAIKGWIGIFSDDEAEELSTRWHSEGVYATKVALPKTSGEVKRYPVKESYIFNLESMHDKIYCLIYDVQDHKIALPFEVAGKTIKSEDDLYDLMDEASALECKAKSSRGVTGKEYGRIKEIVAWRVNARYNTCMAAGMSEAEAGRCFEDM